MKRNFLLFSAFVATAMLLVSPSLFTNIVQPPAGYTGAFLGGGGNEPTCATAGCHEGGNPTLNSSAITITNVGSPSLQSGFAASTQYNLAVNAGSAAAYGFSLTAVSANGAPIGTFALTSPATTSLATGNASKQYVGHKDANTNNAWVFKWTSPASTSEAAYFFLAVNQANNNGESTGDQIHLKAYKADATSFAPYNVSTGIQDINALADGKITVFPNPVVSDLNLDFSLTSGKQVEAAIYNLGGQLVKPLMSEQLSWGDHSRTFAVGELSTGIYLVKFNVGSAEYFKKIVVE